MKHDQSLVNDMELPTIVHLQTNDQRAYSGINELWDAEIQLKNYNQAIVNRFQGHLAGKHRILDFGAGIGSLARIWRDSWQVRPDCFEIDPSLRSVLEDRGFMAYSELDSLPGKYEGVYTSNVLEHIEDDVQALRSIHELLEDDAVLVIFVPAFMCLFSGMDLAVGHYRRYGQRELREKLITAEFMVVQSCYVDSIGFFAALALRYFGHRDGSILGNARSMGFYDRYIYPLSQLLDKLGARFLLGKNILVVARKKPLRVSREGMLA
ncbi:MAG: class I SAM-dependent methyltransferase [Gammaproteobacteria bacterium]|nr:class I SAM-dependent methyltransferase [Gammaproteobacteria bacterium]MBU0788318.1 class I SAM-dependent methyltransferase [Gammaproteobacteria bacterium]MBU0815185.1 class I SAM-dependent methyltransferase [Gammaproteobacteria bacterium]MBU1785707.1 class I SAM-dependent methyltransferase [Gammaproteobacteria bacterium]